MIVLKWNSMFFIIVINIEGATEKVNKFHTPAACTIKSFMIINYASVWSVTYDRNLKS
jgi:hypothetical protein